MTDKNVSIINPDLDFVNQVISRGAVNLKKCFQCGNCTAVCDVTHDNNPFPRNEMILAQWGVKEKLLGNVNIWLCHQCNDCSKHCPRGANPGDLFAAIRNISFEHYSPYKLGKFFSNSSYLPFLILIPALIIFSLILLTSTKGFIDMKPIVFSNMMPITSIDAVFLPTVILAAVGMLFSLGSLWSDFKKTGKDIREKPLAMIPSMIAVAKGIMKHDKMKKCTTNKGRTSYHFSLMYGFLGLAITTSLVALIFWLNKFGVDINVTPLPLAHPVKILGNISALLAFIGVFVIFTRRKRMECKVVGKTSWYDSFFMSTLATAIATGILSETLRLIDTAYLAFGIYYIHLISVFMLLVYAPFSKFAHMFYRFAALTFFKMYSK